MMRSAPWRLTVVFFAGLAALGVLSGAQAFTTPRLKPPAPGPTYLTKADHDRLTDVAAALKKKQFAAARAHASRIADANSQSLGQWMYFMAEDPLVSITAADEFLDAHPDWPATGRIQSFVEKRIVNKTPAQDVLALFQSRDPITGEGKVQLARAFYATGKKDAGNAMLRDAWVNHNFRVAEERRILSAYGGRLTKEDHAARVDRLLWGRQVTNSRRIFSRLSAADRRAAEARAAFLLGAGSAPGLYRKLSADQQMDSGMLHAAVRYYRRTGDEQYAIALTQKAPQDPEALRNSGRWWYERQLLMRWALREGRFGDAYLAAAHHGLEPGSSYAEAEFNAGWIALRFLDDPQRAETHFLALASAVATPISISRSYYWLGRAAAARSESDLAQSYYQAAAKHYYSYYGQLAAEELGGDALAKKFAPPLESSPEDRALFSSRPAVAALRKLSDLNLDYEFMVFAYHIDDLLERPGEFIELAKLTNGEGAPHLTVRAGKVAIQKNAFAPDVAYPLVFVPDETERFIAKEIVLGLSRQESEFNPRAFSHAGARGLMQLIPSTAQLTARKEGLRYSRSALLDDPVYNMTLGSAHLSHLVSRFDGSLIMTFASYNAGPHRVDRWVREYGDPRISAVDPVDWVELIPFSETRNYVQRVLENVQVYRGRLNDTPIPGRLSADLERGGPRNRAAAAPRPAIITVNAAGQSVPSLPQRTIERAEEYANLRLAEFIAPEPPIEEAAPVKIEEPRAEPDRRRRRSSRRSRRAPAQVAAAAALAEAAAETQTEAPAPIAPTPIANDILAGSDVVVTSSAEVVAATANETPAAPSPAPAVETETAPAAVVTAEAPDQETTSPETSAAEAEAILAAQERSITAALNAAQSTTQVDEPSEVDAIAQVVAQLNDNAAATTDTSPTETQSAVLMPPVITAVPTSAVLDDAENAADAAAAETTDAAPPTYVEAPRAPAAGIADLIDRELGDETITAAIPETDESAAPGDDALNDLLATVDGEDPALDDPESDDIVDAVLVSEEATNPVAEALGLEEWCRAYREYLARNAGDDADAEDLNAIALSELQDGRCGAGD